MAYSKYATHRFGEALSHRLEALQTVRREALQSGGAAPCRDLSRRLERACGRAQLHGSWSDIASPRLLRGQPLASASGHLSELQNLAEAAGIIISMRGKRMCCETDVASDCRRRGVTDHRRAGEGEEQRSVGMGRSEYVPMSGDCSLIRRQTLAACARENHGCTAGEICFSTENDPASNTDTIVGLSLPPTLWRSDRRHCSSFLPGKPGACVSTCACSSAHKGRQSQQWCRHEGGGRRRRLQWCRAGSELFGFLPALACVLASDAAWHRIRRPAPLPSFFTALAKLLHQ